MLGHVSTFFVRALVPAAVYSAFALARKYLPTPVPPSNVRVSPEELTERFSTLQWVAGISMVVVGIIFAVSTHAVFVWLNRYSSISQSPDGLRLWPQTATWWFFPGFGALALSWEIVLTLWAFGDRNEASLYQFWSNQRAGFDCTRVLRGMALVIALPIGVLTTLAVPMHSTLRQSDIIDCGYAFKPCQTYQFADARRMTQVDGFRNRDGKLNARAGIVIDFNDGRRWSSADWGDFSRSINPALPELLKARTGLQLGYAATEADIGGSLERTGGSSR
jgi:hypothetical protein